jgi:hypothetical protein
LLEDSGQFNVTAELPVEPLLLHAGIEMIQFKTPVAVE